MPTIDKGIPIPTGNKWYEKIRRMTKGESFAFSTDDWSSIRGAVVLAKNAHPKWKFKTMPDPEKVNDRRLWRER